MHNLSAYSFSIIDKAITNRLEGGQQMHKIIGNRLLKSALIRAARTFLQTFLAVLLASPVLNFTGPTLKAAAVAGLASVLSLAHRFLDQTSVPSLADTNAAAPAPTPATEPALAAEPAPAVAG